VITLIEGTRYRCFDKLDVELGGFRVLVDANGLGKKTLPALRAWFPAEAA